MPPTPTSLGRIVLIGFIAFGLSLPVSAAPEKPEWAEPMRKVHVKFTGKPGSLALFGDSITVSMAFWAPLGYDPKGLTAEGRAALERVKAYTSMDTFPGGRGAEFGSEGGMTIRWADENIDAWLKKLNPEVAVVMFGTNDLNGVPPEEYEQKTRRVAQKCLDNGTIVILTTIPPRSGKLAESKQLAEAVRRVATALKVPVIDYSADVLRRRPNDWDGTGEKFKQTAAANVYDVPTLISGDGVHPSAPQKYSGDFSDEVLNSSGYNLRSYLTLLAYDQVIRTVLKPE